MCIRLHRSKPINLAIFFKSQDDFCANFATFAIFELNSLFFEPILIHILSEFLELKKKTIARCKKSPLTSLDISKATDTLDVTQHNFSNHCYFTNTSYCYFGWIPYFVPRGGLADPEGFDTRGTSTER